MEHLRPRSKKILVWTITSSDSSWSAMRAANVTKSPAQQVFWHGHSRQPMGSYSRQFSGKRSGKCSDRDNFQYRNCNRGTGRECCQCRSQDLRTQTWWPQYNQEGTASAKNPIHSFSTLSDPQLGMMMVTNAEIFAHFEATHSVLNDDDFVLIFLRVSALYQ